MGRIHVLIIFSTLLGQLIASGQEKLNCGTDSKVFFKELRGTLPNEAECTYIKKVKRTLQITLHICENEAGSTGVSQAQINSALNLLNSDFAPCGLQFTYCLQENMQDFQFNAFKQGDHEEQMMLMYFKPNTINVYLCSTVETIADGPVNGYTYMPGPGTKDILVISKAGFGTSRTFSHEMGHYFGLLHTFESNNGTELVDGSNCDVAGDLICDTAADPDPNGNANPNNDCNYTGAIVTDSNGDYYVPPTFNIMSYYPNICTCRFTPMQYNRMTSQYQLNRSYLW
ncbi:MAG: hypothetical protein IT223_01560 [Crocinitomicaceae bacterium]|nr:hypothetical protein [Crocinitomicaceae bacterium]